MKILMITTISKTFGFLEPHIQYLKHEGHSVELCSNIVGEVDEVTKKMQCKVHDIPFSRSPFSMNNLRAYKELDKLIKSERFDIIHTHTPVASVISRLVVKKHNIPIIYTTHGFHMYKGAPMINWLLYYPIEKYLSRHTELLITINEEDYNLAINKMKAKKVRKINGIGFDSHKFNLFLDYKEKLEIFKDMGITTHKEDTFYLISAGEINRNKNHIIILEAMAQINNPKIHYLICGTGPLENKIISESVRLGIRNQVHLLGYRADMDKILQISDVFVFPSLREGLGIAALEAMAAGRPIITSNIHGIVDYSVNNITGYTCDPNDSDCFSKAIMKLYDDRALVEEMGKNNKSKVEKYDISNVLLEMENLYAEFDLLE